MTAASELARVADTFWEDVLREVPVWATVLGDRRYDDRLDDNSPQGLARNRQMLAGHLDAVRAIDAGDLDDAQRVTHQTLIDVLDGELHAIQSGIQEWNVDPMSGPQTTFMDLPDYQTVTTPEHGRRMVARWRGMGRYLDQTIANLRESMADGRVSVARNVERTIDELEGLAACEVADWKVADPAKLALADWSDADRDRFRGDLLSAVRDVIIPAFGRYQETLEGSILPGARSNDRPGLCQVPEGDAAYRDLIRYHTNLDLDPNEVHRIGLDEIARIDAAFVELGGRLLGTRDLASTLAALRGDRKLRFETADEVFDTARRSLDRAKAAIPDWFGRLPVADCDVVPVPEHSQAHQTIAYYVQPALDGSRPGRYYINLYQPETRPRYEA